VIIDDVMLQVRIKTTAPIASYSRGRLGDAPPFAPMQATAPPPQIRPNSYTVSPAMPQSGPPQQSAGPPAAIQPLTMSQTVPAPSGMYQEPPPQPPTRVFTPQPAVIQAPPPTMQPVVQPQPPPQAIAVQAQPHPMPAQAHQFPPGTVQLVPAPQVNIDLVDSLACVAPHFTDPNGWNRVAWVAFRSQCFYL